MCSGGFLRVPLLSKLYVTEAGHARMMAWYEAELAHIQVPHERVFVPTRFGSTHVITAGDPLNFPVVLVHGININASVWRQQIDGLALFCRVYAPDVPGFAGQSASTRIPYTGRGYADWLTDLFDQLGLDRALAVGSSAGGFFALKLAAFAPERVAGLLLLNPAGLTPFRAAYYNWLCNPRVAHITQKLARRVLYSRAIVQHMVERGMYGPASASNVDLAMLLLHDYWRAPAPKPMPRPELHRVTAPTYLLVSEHELYTDPQRVMLTAQTVLPNLIGVECVPQAGHDINKEQPHLVNDRILSLSPQPATIV